MLGLNEQLESKECLVMDFILPNYRLSKEEYKELWDNCIFVLDTNVLFNLYRYSPKLRERFIEILDKISNRIWIPHQVALEYYNNKSMIINTEINKYKIILDIVSNCSKDIKNDIIKRDLSRKYTATSEITSELIKKIDDSFDIINKDLKDIIDKYPQKEDFAHIDQTISKLFTEKVGKPYSIEVLEQLSEEASRRYKLELPPGYEDEKEKKGIKKYGDLILWFQIIDMAKEKKKPVILICEDLKGDWWWAPSGMTVGPRHELVQEFALKTEMLFYMYSLDQFMSYANEYINTKVEKEIIEEAKEYRVEEEIRKMDTGIPPNVFNGIQDAKLMLELGSDGPAGAGMTAGLALEAYLKHLCVINDIICDDKSTIRELAQTLLTEGVIDNVEFAKLAYLATIRNKCAHSKDISKYEVESIIGYVKKMIS